LTIMTKTLVACGLLALLTAPVIWFAGHQWAGRECFEGGRGADLLDGAEGSIEIVGDACRATSPSGEVREVPLSEWQWNGAALTVAAAGAAVLGGAVATGGRRP
jgi:hypothetical protein